MQRVKLTDTRVKQCAAEPGKDQSFWWDSEVPGLAVRVTARWQPKTNEKAKAFIFQSKLAGKDLRITIGECQHWTVDQARSEARRLALLIDQGKDPRQVATEERAAALARKAALAAQAEQKRVTELRARLTLADVWPEYLKEHKDEWSANHYAAQLRAVSPGGVAKKRGSGLTVAGPLASLMNEPLSKLTAARIAAWVKHEAKTRPSSAALAFRLLRAFIFWTQDPPPRLAGYKGLVPTEGLASKTMRKAVPESKARSNTLQREQLAVWFAAVRQIANPVQSAYLQGLLITGARRRELSGLRWKDVDFQWNSLTIRDKVEEIRVIPLTPYLAHLLKSLPRRGNWVFSSERDTGGPITEGRFAHMQALEVAGLPHISLHDLRRSFATLAEWVEMPSGIAAQIMGHKPSATAEKHYIKRPLDLLRKWHTKIESWMLEEAGISFTPEAQPIRLVSSNVSTA